MGCEVSLFMPGGGGAKDAGARVARCVPSVGTDATRLRPGRSFEDDCNEDRNEDVAVLLS